MSAKGSTAIDSGIQGLAQAANGLGQGVLGNHAAGPTGMQQFFL